MMILWEPDPSLLTMMQENHSVTNSLYGTPSSDSGADAASTYSSEASAVTLPNSCSVAPLPCETAHAFSHARDCCPQSSDGK